MKIHPAASTIGEYEIIKFFHPKGSGSVKRKNPKVHIEYIEAIINIFADL